MGEHPFNRELAQVAIVVKDIEAAGKRFASLLGVDVPKVIETAPGNEVNLVYRGTAVTSRAKLAFLDAGPVQIELIEPIGSDCAWAEGLDEKGERVHHLAFWTENMRDAVAHLDAHGAPLIMRGDMGEGQYPYFDGQEMFGCYIELLERKRTELA